MTKTLLALACAAAALAAPAAAQSKSRNAAPAARPAPCITEQEVVEAQKAWGEGIVRIGKTYTEGGDYVAAASRHIDQFYAYDLSLVLFKPTLASQDQFRSTCT